VNKVEISLLDRNNLQRGVDEIFKYVITNMRERLG
jgi:hypothetical protein